MRMLQAIKDSIRLAQRRRAVERFKRRQAQWKGVDMSVEEILKSRHEGHRF